MLKRGWVYILTNAHHSVLYTGVTSNLLLRVDQHRTHYFPQSFTAKYNCTQLVYFREFEQIVDAISEEKRIKAGSRAAKERLICSMNPSWMDLWEKLSVRAAHYFK